MLFRFGDVDVCVSNWRFRFVGSCLCEELVKRGCEVSFLDDFSSGSRSNCDLANIVNLFIFTYRVLSGVM